jgi:hypothetical protein
LLKLLLAHEELDINKLGPNNLPPIAIALITKNFDAFCLLLESSIKNKNTLDLNAIINFNEKQYTILDLIESITPQDIDKLKLNFNLSLNGEIVTKNFKYYSLIDYSYYCDWHLLSLTIIRQLSILNIFESEEFEKIMKYPEITEYTFDPETAQNIYERISSQTILDSLYINLELIENFLQNQEILLQIFQNELTEKRAPLKILKIINNFISILEDNLDLVANAINNELAITDSINNLKDQLAESIKHYLILFSISAGASELNEATTTQPNFASNILNSKFDIIEKALLKNVKLWLENENDNEWSYIDIIYKSLVASDYYIDENQLVIILQEIDINSSLNYTKTNPLRIKNCVKLLQKTVKKYIESLTLDHTNRKIELLIDFTSKDITIEELQDTVDISKKLLMTMSAIDKSLTGCITEEEIAIQDLEQDIRGPMLKLLAVKQNEVKDLQEWIEQNKTFLFIKELYTLFDHNSFFTKEPIQINLDKICEWLNNTKNPKFNNVYRDFSIKALMSSQIITQDVILDNYNIDTEKPIYFYPCRLKKFLEAAKKCEDIDSDFEDKLKELVDNHHNNYIIEQLLKETTVDVIPEQEPTNLSGHTEEAGDQLN